MLYRWAKKKNHHLTDSLLTIIEENAVYKVAFGFDKGDDDNNTGNGKRVGDHHLKLAEKLFIDVEDAIWISSDLSKLKEVVKNYIGR